MGTSNNLTDGTKAGNARTKGSSTRSAELPLCSLDNCGHFGHSAWVVADADGIPVSVPTDTARSLSKWPLALGCTGAVLLAALVVVILLHSEPRSVTQEVVSLVILAVGAVMIVVASLLARRRRLRLTLAALVVSLVAGFMVNAGVEAVHWRWSQARFAGVVAGQTVSCRADRPCRLGWWDVVGSHRYKEVLVVMLPANSGCYAGRGLAFPLKSGLGGHEIEESLSREGIDYVSASAWRDGWYELCFTT